MFQEENRRILSESSRVHRGSTDRFDLIIYNDENRSRHDREYEATDMCVIGHQLEEEAREVHEEKIRSVSEDPEEEVLGKKSLYVGSCG